MWVSLYDVVDQWQVLSAAYTVMSLRRVVARWSTKHPVLRDTVQSVVIAHRRGGNATPAFRLGQASLVATALLDCMRRTQAWTAEHKVLAVQRFCALSEDLGNFPAALQLKTIQPYRTRTDRGIKKVGGLRRPQRSL